MELGHKHPIENQSITTGGTMYDQGYIRSRKISNCIDVPLPCSKRTEENLSSSMSPSISSFCSISTSNSFSQSLTSRPRTCSLSSKTVSGRLSSPISGLVPRALRNSFSKLLRRGSISGDDLKSPSHEDANTFTSDSQHSMISPITEEIVKDSIEKGLPIIPFSCPTFSIADKRYEESMKRNKKKSLHKFEVESQRKSGQKTIHSSVKSKETFNYTHNIEEKVSSDIQSAYVEMDPADDELSRSYHHPIGWDDNPYMNIDELSNMEDDAIFDMEDKELFKETVSSCCPREKKPEFIDWKNHIEHVDTNAGHFGRKGNRHKDDYVYIDLQHTNERGKKSRSSNRWSILKFSTITLKH